MKYFRALKCALRDDNVSAIESMVQPALHAYAKALFFGARQPRIYNALIFIAWECVTYCKVTPTRRLLHAGLPVDSILCGASPQAPRFTMLETAVYYSTRNDGEVELIDMLLVAGASCTRAVQIKGDFRDGEPITSFITAPAIARVFMNHGVPKSAFTSMPPNISAEL